MCVSVELLCGRFRILHLTNPKQKHFDIDLSSVFLLLFVVHGEIWLERRLRQRFYSRNHVDAFLTHLKIRFASPFRNYAFEGTGISPARSFGRRGEQ